METRSCLNGYWDFLPVPDGEDFSAALERNDWITGRYLVPSSWRSEREMYNIFDYPKSWDDIHRGILRRSVTVRRKQGKRYFLRLDAVGQQCRVLVNGQCLSESQDMFFPVEAEVTALLSGEETTLEILVECDVFPTVTRPDGAVKQLVPAGTWYAGITRGIWQDAWLVERSEVYLHDPAIVTRVCPNTLSVTAETDGGTGVITGRVLDKDGNSVLSLDESLTAAFPDAHLWMPDDPYLYTLELTLTRDGKPLDTLTQRFGFREFTVKGPELFINGVHIHLRGDAWHYQGLAMQSKAYAENWMRMAREQGINFIRPHGFPYPQCFYDAADECGMLLLAESGIYGSGKAMQADDARFVDACRAHLVRFVRAYRCHPSVFMWSIQNEMRWVDGRDEYAKTIPGLMAIVHREDPSGRRVSCDGDNRLLSPEMMEVVSMHYNIDGLVSDWDKTKPLMFGEHGAFHYVAPQAAAAMGGNDTYLSFWKSMEGLAKREALFYRYARREGVTGVTPFNYVHYLNKSMPFADRPLEQGDVTAPGVHPSVMRAWSLTVNNGRMPDIPLHLPQPGMAALREVTSPIALLEDQCDSFFYSGIALSRTFRLYNDTYHDHAVSVRAVAELPSGQVLLAENRAFSQMAGSSTELDYVIPVPAGISGVLTLSFTVCHEGKPVLEKQCTYTLSPEDTSPAWDGEIVCLVGERALPDWIGSHVTYVKNLDALSCSRGQLLLLGEDLPWSQKELQPVLETLLREKRFSAVLILAQTEFSPGLLRLSRRPFFSACKTGDHPIFDGLPENAFAFWGAENPEETTEHWMVENGFDLPEEPGFRVLLECSQGDFGWGGTKWCAMAECMTMGIPVVMTQLRLGDFAPRCPIAAQLLRRSIRYLGTYAASSQKGILLSADALDEAQALLRQGYTVTVTDVTPDHADALSTLLGRPVSVVPAPVYQVEPLHHPLTRNISPADVFGMDRMMYSTAAQKNIPVAQYAIEAEGTEALFVSADCPWEEMVVREQQAEAIKIAAATKYAQEAHTRRVYGFAAPACGGTLAVLALDARLLRQLQYASALVSMNGGANPDTGLFSRMKAPTLYAIPEYMWLPVEPHWDYDAAVKYHAAPDYLLNNLGEGSYGWMRRVSALSGTAALTDGGKTGAFATVFVRCDLNHNPEHREPGVIPDPSIVPDLTVTCNTAFDLYVNGHCYPGFSAVPDAPQEIVLEDVLLEKGLNRVFFRLSPREGDIVLGAVFRDKVGEYLTDASYEMTLD